MKTGRGYGKPVIPFYLLWSAVLAVAFIIAVAKPANAETIEPEPVVSWGWTTDSIVVQGPHYAWGSRKVMRYIDDELPGLTIYFGKCYLHPYIPCVKIRTDEYGREGWVGMMTPAPLGADILFNESYMPSVDKLYAGSRQNIACHETLHMLGMPHHSAYGCLNQRLPYPSEAEMEALREFYN